jgi:hypothetical protein
MAKKQAAKAKEPDADKLIKGAIDAGRLARQNREPFGDCPYSMDDPLRAKWEQGWNDEIAHETKPEVLLNQLKEIGVTTGLGDLEMLSFFQRTALLDWIDRGMDIIDDDEVGKLRPGFVRYTDKVIPADENEAEYRVIAFDGSTAPEPATELEKPQLPAIAPLAAIPPQNEHEASLRDLLTQLDNLGVLIEETQWRRLNLSEESEKSVRTWAKWRTEDQSNRSPLPLFLQPFASEALKAEWTAYAEGQERARQEKFRVTFDKPSVVAPGEDDEGKIKVVAKASAEDLPGGMADRLFRYKRCKIHFSTRTIEQWDQAELFDSNPIYATISDVSGYKASRHETSFSFLVDQETLGVQAAFKELWGFTGTVQVEVLGVADGAKKKPSENSGTSKPLAGQKSLPGTDDEDDEEEDLEEEDPDPVQYLVAHDGDLKVSMEVYKESDGWYVDVDADTPEGWEAENDDIATTMQPRDTPIKALETRVGQIIDHWQQWKDNPSADQVIRQLRMWVVELSNGTDPAAIQAAVEAERNHGAVSA